MGAGFEYLAQTENIGGKVNFADYHFYTIAHGKRFAESAVRCADSFVSKNSGLKFTVFVDDLCGVPRGTSDVIKTVIPPYFNAGALAVKPYANLLLHKFARLPFAVPGKEKYIGQIDSDCLCMCKLPLEYFVEDLDAGKFCASSDPKVEVNKREINAIIPDIYWRLYFNSGVCFWPRAETGNIFHVYESWVLKNQKMLWSLKYQDQTWLNIWLNQYHQEKLSEIGWYWNYRGTARHKRAYIWHAGGRDSEGIEVLKAEYESWKN